MWTHWERLTGPVSQMAGMSPGEVMERIRTGDAYYPHMRGELDFEEFHRRMASCLGLDLSADEFLTLWNGILEPNPDIKSIVDRLKGRYRLVIGSNTDVPHFARSCEVQPVTREFKEALLSYELGYCKPDPAFFSEGLEKLGVSSQECVFIDDLEENVEAARLLGITGIQFSSTGQVEADLSRIGIL